MCVGWWWWGVVVVGGVEKHFSVLLWTKTWAEDWSLGPSWTIDKFAFIDIKTRKSLELTARFEENRTHSFVGISFWKCYGLFDPPNLFWVNKHPGGAKIKSWHFQLGNEVSDPPPWAMILLLVLSNSSLRPRTRSWLYFCWGQSQQSQSHQSQIQ